MKPVYFNRRAFEKIFKECMDLGQRKCNDYGAVGDAIAMGGVRGIAIRGLDKQLRIMSLTQDSFDAQVKDESLRDTLRDQINYAVYAIALLDGTWGVEPSTQEQLNGVPKTQEDLAIAACIEADNYLRANPLNQIGSGSALHHKLQEAAHLDMPF